MKNTPTLICISSDEVNVTYSLNGEIETTYIQDDQDGMYYYMVNGKGYYLPDIFQPVLSEFKGILR